MLVIPTAAVAAQALTVEPSGQQLLLTFRQLSTGLFADINVGARPVLRGVLCRDRVRLVRDAYLGVTGDLMWADQQGTSDPTWDGLGTRFVLYWLAAAEYEGLTTT